MTTKLKAILTKLYDVRRTNAMYAFADVADLLNTDVEPACTELDEVENELDRLYEIEKKYNAMMGQRVSA